MRTVSKAIALLSLLAAAACDESPVSLPEPSSVAVADGAMSLLVGDAAPVSAQVLDEDGRVMEGLEPMYRTDNPSVATVGTDGMVQAVSPGSARITAVYGTHSAQVSVTVARDHRSDVQSLDLLADSVVADRRGGPQAVAFRGLNGYGQPLCPDLVLTSSDPSVAVATMAGTCRIQIDPLFAGQTTITATAGGQSDSVRVRVTNTGATAFVSARPSAGQLVAGATVRYTVTVLDEFSRPLQGQRVNFQVGAGSLSSTTVLTGASGKAEVEWTLPTDLRNRSQNQTIAYRAVLPGQVVVGQTEWVFINGASLARIEMYAYTQANPAPAQMDSLLVPSEAWAYVGAAGKDQYGNDRVVNFSFSVSGTYRFWSCGGSEGNTTISGLQITCFRGNRGQRATVTAHAPSGAQRSLVLNFR